MTRWKDNLANGGKRSRRSVCGWGRGVSLACMYSPRCYGTKVPFQPTDTLSLTHSLYRTPYHPPSHPFLLSTLRPSQPTLPPGAPEWKDEISNGTPSVGCVSGITAVVSSSTVQGNHEQCKNNKCPFIVQLLGHISANIPSHTFSHAVVSSSTVQGNHDSPPSPLPRLHLYHEYTL